MPCSTAWCPGPRQLSREPTPLLSLSSWFKWRLLSALLGQSVFFFLLMLGRDPGVRVGGLRGAGAAPHLCDGVVTPPSRRSMCGAQRPAPPPTRLAGGRPSGGGRAGGLQDTRAGPASCSAARQACGSLTAELLFRPAWGTARPPRGSAWPGGASVQRALLEPCWEPGGRPPGSSPAPSGRHVWQLPVICVLRTLSGSRLDQKWLESLGEGQAFPGWVAAFVGGSLGPPHTESPRGDAEVGGQVDGRPLMSPSTMASSGQGRGV